MSEPSLTLKQILTQLKILTPGRIYLLDKNDYSTVIDEQYFLTRDDAHAYMTTADSTWRYVFADEFDEALENVD